MQIELEKIIKEVSSDPRYVKLESMSLEDETLFYTVANAIHQEAFPDEFRNNDWFNIEDPFKDYKQVILEAVESLDVSEPLPTPYYPDDSESFRLIRVDVGYLFHETKNEMELTVYFTKVIADEMNLDSKSIASSQAGRYEIVRRIFPETDNFIDSSMASFFISQQDRCAEFHEAREFFKDLYTISSIQAVSSPVNQIMADLALSHFRNIPEPVTLQSFAKAYIKSINAIAQRIYQT